MKIKEKYQDKKQVELNKVHKEVKRKILKRKDQILRMK